MAEDSTSTGTAPKKAKKIRLLTGCNIGSARFEEGEVIPAQLMSAATRQAWIEQGLVEEVR